MSTSTRTRYKTRYKDVPPWMGKPSTPGLIVKYVVIAIILALVIYPFWTVVATSLANQTDISSAGGLVIWPNHPTLISYATILQGGVVTQALLVSTGITLVGTLCSVMCSVAIAYGLSRPGSFGHRPILMIVLLTMLFSAGIIPNFLVVKEIGLLDHYAALIVPVLINAFNVVVLRNFFMGIPQELIDSARIDGAGDLTILLRIVLPLSKAVVAVVALFEAVAYWNAFFNAMLYLNDATKWPLALILRQYVLQGQPAAGSNLPLDAMAPQDGIQMAVVVIAVVPILIVYPFLQRFFTKGVLTGAVKG